ncbi:Rieske 2Fe-2S domain-containing protein [Sphingomonas sp. 28-63-12]|uniref:Rieske 2Fe-2S domain-containing protein n=1 Tax=Sphingomonas sp. 28-63-12 TaxID=1970434 RepID=UPI000BD0DC52|nr:MAG: (2Fe-2S)-binding protein [Sphingomonas sp. 28-63-12]
MGDGAIWWAVARSEEVTAKRPLAIDIGNQPVVLWRDATGSPRALEDRCPHRRAPLSLGCIKPDGMIQCGYHGWIYDGETGRLKEIPNLKDQPKFPPVYRALAFAVTESAGFVRVCLDAKAPAPIAATTVLPMSDSVHVALDHTQYVAALFDDPGLVMAIRGVRFTAYLMSELREERGRLVMERSCQWRGLHWPAPFSPEFPATLLTATDPATGETELTLRDANFKTHLHAMIAPVPSARGVTAVRWRADRPKRLTVRDSIDAGALRTLRPSASLHGADLRAALLASDAAHAA